MTEKWPKQPNIWAYTLWLKYDIPMPCCLLKVFQFWRNFVFQHQVNSSKYAKQDTLRHKNTDIPESETERWCFNVPHLSATSHCFVRISFFNFILKRWAIAQTEFINNAFEHQKHQTSIKNRTKAGLSNVLHLFGISYYLKSIVF
jgi:hypothetical protein